MGKGRRQDLSSERSEKGRIQKLNEIIRAQKRKIAALERELNRRSDVSDDYRELLQEVDAEPAPTPKKKLTCPKCGKDVVEAPIGVFTLERCTSCDWRKRRK
jgi:hypothetical protein